MAAWCTNRARGVVIGWCIALFVVLIAGTIAGEHNRSTFRLPGANSQVANDLINRAFPSERGDAEAIVISSTAGKLTDPTERAHAEALFAKLRQIPGVVTVSNPLDGGTTAGITPDHKTAIAVLKFRQDSLSVPASETTHLVNALTASRTDTFQAAAMGWGLEDANANPPPFVELVGLIAAAIVLFIAFGSGVAVAVAMGNALVSLGLSFGLLELATHVIAIPYFEPQIALTIGLGIGIDYSLLTVARYRGARQRGSATSNEVAEALKRTGRTVTFAGCTVILAMTGLLATPIGLVRGMTAGVVLAVVPTILASNSLLPALLQLTDKHLDRGRIRFFKERKLVERSPGWARWSAAVQRRPITALLGSLMVLGILATPMLWLRIGPADGSIDNNNSMTGQAYQMASKAFGPGVTAPLDVVTSFPEAVRPDSPQIQRVRDDLLRTDNVMYVAPAIFSPSGPYVMFKVIPTTAPDSIATRDLMNELRTTFTTQLRAQNIDVAVGGLQAIQLDLGTTVLHDLPITILAVIGGSFILLLLQFRSIVLALKAGLMNLLSISAAFGIVVAIFQWGWGSHLIGVDHAGPIQNFLPLLLFPAVFGLSMDYEVFLLSRITDEWERTNDSRAAVTEGLATTGRVVTSGAAIMFALFAAMALSRNRTVEMFGVGLAVAVLLDATLIRSLLLPAAMQLLGRYNWWIPAWLERRLPTVVRHA